MIAIFLVYDVLNGLTGYMGMQTNRYVVIFGTTKQVFEKCVLGANTEHTNIIYIHVSSKAVGGYIWRQKL
jgi:hypothetical protein